MPKISITIPAYKNVPALQRLLDSIASQTYKDYEVIVTDDTPDISVKEFITSYQRINGLKYYKNPIPLGTPENWNEGIRKATGEWIKIMHHDDYFATADALLSFAKHTTENIDFIFSGYANHFHQTDLFQPVHFSKTDSVLIGLNPWTLFASNTIGPPSVTLVRRKQADCYDKNLKWRVDTEYYIRQLQRNSRFTHIRSVLVNVGIHESQVTKSTFLHPEVELTEGLYLLQKHGDKPLRNVLVYDAWWRLFRNLNIYKMEDVLSHAAGEWPDIVQKLLSDIERCDKALLRKGIYSKSLMFKSYIRNVILNET